jgi:hypothetical protein
VSIVNAKGGQRIHRIDMTELYCGARVSPADDSPIASPGTTWRKAEAKSIDEIERAMRARAPKQRDDHPIHLAFTYNRSQTHPKTYAPPACEERNRSCSFPDENVDVRA